MALINVSEFAAKYKLRLPFAYQIARELPPGIRVQFGSKVKINEERLENEWVQNGGSLTTRKNESDKANER